MTKKRKIIISSLVGVAVCVVAIAMFSGGTPAAEVSTSIVQRGNLVQSIDATGTVETLEKVDLSFNASGSVKVLNVRVGDSVKVGQVLASISSGDLYADVLRAQALLAQKRAGATAEQIAVAQQDVVTAEAALASAKVDLVNAQADVTNAQVSGAASVATAEDAVETAIATTDLAVKQAREDLITALSGAMVDVRDVMYDADQILGVENASQNDSFEPELGALDSSVLRSAQSAYQVAMDERNTTESSVLALSSTSSDSALENVADSMRDVLADVSLMLLYTRQTLEATLGGTSTLSTTRLDAFKAAIDTGRSAIATRQTTFNTSAQAWTTAQQNVLTQVQAAENAVVTAQASADRDEAKSQAQVESAQARISQREADLARAQAALAQLTAPVRSVDLASLQADVAAAQARYEKATIISPLSGIVTAVEVDYGSQINAGTVAITVQAIDQAYKIPVNIPEADIAKITLGNTAAVTLDAFGDDMPFTATVTAIDPAEKVIQGVVFYQATLMFTSPDVQMVKPGMSANVTIETARKEGVLYLPQRSVLEEDGKKFVRVPNNSEDPSSFDVVYVTTGLRANDGLLEIVSGVSEGQTVILTIKNP
jgi:HlyD family secretion protein